MGWSISKGCAEEARDQLFNRLLGELIYAIQEKNLKSHHRDLNHLWVHFFAKDGTLVTDDVGVAQALDYLHNDIWHFAEFDLTDADRLEVHVH